MTSDSETRASTDALQFDHAVETGTTASEVRCSLCGQPVGDAYFHAGRAVICARCKDTVVAAREERKSPQLLLQGAALGLGAAIAGAVVYYAIAAFLKLELALVTILIGYMVGRGVRTGARGHGGRRFQILAVALTYLSVGLAYASLLVQAAVAQGGTIGTGAAGFLAWMTVTLPVRVVFDSMPGGLLTALIIGVGLLQAWRLTADASPAITGPYRVGAATGAGA